MENTKNISSEQELLELLNEGKINKDEYEQLLLAMKKQTSSNIPLGVTEKQNILIPLKIVAWLFIISGILAFIEILITLMKGHISLDFGVLGLFIGYGLLKLSRGWRTCALIYLWIFFIGMPTISILYITQPSGGFNVHIFGQPLARNPYVILYFNVIFILLSLWIYRILTRAETKSLFGINNQ